MTEAELEDLLSAPLASDVEALSALDGDILVLGAGGKMGPSLVARAVRARDLAGVAARVIAVSRTAPPISGAESVSCDLLQPGVLQRLPEAPNIIFMAGFKFGAAGEPGRLWMVNTVLPALVAERFRTSRIVVFSTGNVYPLTPVVSGGPGEDSPIGPIGEYAWSALGRERAFEYASRAWSAQVAILRLNYAVECRYGVLLDIGRKVLSGEPVDLAMGHVNVIWQGDANSVAIRSLRHCGNPPFVLNLTGPETLSVRDIASAFGRRLGKQPLFTGVESSDALLSNAGRCAELFGPPSVGVDRIIGYVSNWLLAGGRSLSKPTRFEVRDGKF